LNNQIKKNKINQIHKTMPKDNRNLNKKSSSSSSSKSSKSRSSTHSADTCRDDKCKDLICQERIAVNLDVIPEVRCTKGCEREGKFKVGVRSKTDTDCKIRTLSNRIISPCETECVFEVSVFSKTKFTPEIKSECKLPTAYADLDIRAKTRQRC
jgi:hypothetical protein